MKMLEIMRIEILIIVIGIMTMIIRRAFIRITKNSICLTDKLKLLFSILRIVRIFVRMPLKSKTTI